MKYLSDLQKFFHEHADESKARSMKKYMKDHFEFLGIRSPERRELIRDYVQEHGWPLRDHLEGVVVGLYSLPYREFHYTAVEMADRLMRNTIIEDIHTIEYMLEYNQWWDTVDFVAVNIAGRWLKHHRELANTYFTRWNESNDLWLNRAAIIYQLKYKQDTDLDKLTTAIKRHSVSKEFFHQKAIGLALREYTKTDPVWVRRFVDEHELANLSKREAVKNLKGEIKIK